MTTRISVVIDTNGDRCGSKCWQDIGPRGSAHCHLFSTRLERPCIGSPHEMVPQYEDPIRCDACIRAEKRMREAISAARVECRMAAKGNL